MKQVAGLGHAQISDRFENPGKTARDDDLLARLIQARDASGNPIGRSELTAEVLTQLVAGSDTMSISTCALLFHVVSDKDVLWKLREELDAAIPELNDVPTYDAIKDLQ